MEGNRKFFLNYVRKSKNVKKDFKIRSIYNIGHWYKIIVSSNI